MELVIIVLVILEVIIIVTDDIVHKAVVAATSTAPHQSVRATNKPAVWQFTWAVFVVAAAVAEWDQALCKVPAARHRECLFSACRLSKGWFRGKLAGAVAANQSSEEMALLPRQVGTVGRQK